jgi:hypothetical protein
MRTVLVSLFCFLQRERERVDMACAGMYDVMEEVIARSPVFNLVDHVSGSNRNHKKIPSKSIGDDITNKRSISTSDANRSREIRIDRRDHYPHTSQSIGYICAVRYKQV